MTALAMSWPLTGWREGPNVVAVETARRDPGADEGERRVLDADRAGDRKGALSEAMRLYGVDVFRFCMHLVGDRALAEDVQQHVFEQIYRDLGRFEGKSSLRTWVLSIARNRCLDALRERHRAQERTVPMEKAPDMSDVREDPGRDLDEQELQRQLADCLDRLEPQVRVAVLQRYREGQSYETMASLSGEKPGTLRARVARALPGLRACLESKGVSL